MSEKGGKGFSLPSKGSLKGKDDSSVKSKKGKKSKLTTAASQEPKFTFLPNSDGKSQSVSSKGGKGDKADKSGKTPMPKDQPLELKIGKELPENAKIMLDCEAAHILEGIQEQMVVLSEDSSIKIPVSFARGLQYAKSSSRYTNAESVRNLLAPLNLLDSFGVEPLTFKIRTLEKHGASDGEVCVIANTCPETKDEAFALVPSLKAKQSTINEPLGGVLNELAKLKKST